MTTPICTHPLISVVTVCFNSARHLHQAMESVLALSYPHVEYIVVDGGSTDGTLDIIRSFEPRFGDRLVWVSEPDEGIYDAMNKGISLCTGELIGMLNSDDQYQVEAVQRLVEAYYAKPGSGAVFGDVDVVDEDGTLLSTETAHIPAPGTIPARMPMCHQSLFVARRVYDELGGYDTQYRVLADYEFVLRMLKAGVVMVHVPLPVARFRVGGACNTETGASNLERERIRVLYGANPAIEFARRWRHAVNRFVYDAIVGRRESRPVKPHGEEKSDT